MIKKWKIKKTTKIKVQKCKSNFSYGYEFQKQSFNKEENYYSHLTEDRAESSKEDYPYRRLWQAVIMQAIMDARSSSEKPRKKQLRRDALDWLFKSDKEFKKVATLAGLPWQDVRKKLEKAKYNNFRWRNDRKTYGFWIDEKFQLCKFKEKEGQFLLFNQKNIPVQKARKIKVSKREGKEFLQYYLFE